MHSDFETTEIFLERPVSSSGKKLKREGRFKLLNVCIIGFELKLTIDSLNEIEH